jgi:large subunit ribosomal protein L30
VPSRAKAARPTAKKAKAAKKPAARRPRREKPAGEKQGARLVVKQIRSGIGHAETYRRTLRALGLRHHQAEIVVSDNPSIRGMLTKVHHLVSVRPQEG